MESIIDSRQHPEQGYRAALGTIRLAKGYSDARLNAACRRALTLNVCSFQSIKSILQTGKDQEVAGDIPAGVPAVHHSNVRGAGYYAKEGMVSNVE